MGMVVENRHFELSSGVPHEWAKTADSGATSTNFTCPGCAGWTHTRTQSQPDVTVVRPSTLDDHRWVRPIAQIYTKSALPWASMPVQFTFDEEFKDPTPLAKAFAAGGIVPGKIQDD